MATQNSVGVNTSTIPSVPTIPPPQQPNTPPLEQDQQDLQREIITITEEEPTTLVTGSAVSIIEEEQGDFVFSEDEEYFEEPFTEEVLNEPEDESQYQDFTSETTTIINKDLEKYPFLGVFSNNSGIKNISCRLFEGKAVKEDLITPFLNMKEACLNNIKIPIGITSGFRPAYDDIYNNGKLLATSQKTLRTKSPPTGNLRPEYVGKFKNPEYDSTIIIKTKKAVNLGKSRLTYFRADTAPAGASNHGNGIALDLTTGSRANSEWPSLNKALYEWLINNAWKYGFIRTVSSEEWHWEYIPESAKLGPYTILKKTTTNLFYDDLNII